MIFGGFTFKGFLVYYIPCLDYKKKVSVLHHTAFLCLDDDVKLILTELKRDTFDVDGQDVDSFLGDGKEGKEGKEEDEGDWREATGGR